ncbi:MAG TPA: hypothetical protein VJR89_39140 [Polyangiales bacterium]|nr:hypothetical protein [Polyangiales bacterium]
MDARNEKALDALLRSSFRELFQTETSAVRHCQREAERLGVAPPAAPLRAISRQAEGFLAELPQLARAHKLPMCAGGIAVGELFSQTRDKLADRFIRSERSYRGTMLGLRHGVDLVQLVSVAAGERGYSDITEFCVRWLSARLPLMSELERELAWFAREPAEAMRIARGLFGRRRSGRARNVVSPAT